jgi:lambda family phage portal protein
MAKILPRISAPRNSGVRAGGGLEGAERATRETVSWNPHQGSADAVILPVKAVADARARDMMRNDGYVRGVTRTHQDGIVGAEFRLSATPRWKAIPGGTEAWAEKFELAVEERWSLTADSLDCWMDAAGRKTFTEMVRLAVATHMSSGEVLATAEWVRNDPRRPMKTACQLIAPERLANPDREMDSLTVRGGIQLDKFGRKVRFHILDNYPDVGLLSNYDRTGKWIDARKPWGRTQVIHIAEQQDPGQTRGISAMVAVLKQMHMTKTLSEVTLARAVVNASYAASIESEMPAELIAQQMGASAGVDPTEAYLNTLGAYQTTLAKYYGGGKAIAYDGVKIPVFAPNTKLNVQALSAPGGDNFEAYEQSLLRKQATALGLSYEEFTHDFSKVNYSSARAAMLLTWKYMQAQKTMVADRFATELYSLWLEEQISQGNLPLPRGWTSATFYEPLMKEAMTACEWIGASRGQIDELKETQAMQQRLDSGVSTRRIEAARLGLDWRDLIDQQVREKKRRKDAGLDEATTASVTPPTDKAQAA